MSVTQALLLFVMLFATDVLNTEPEQHEALKHTDTHNMMDQNEITTISNFSQTSQKSPSPGLVAGCHGNQVQSDGQNCSCAAGHSQDETDECKDIDECQQGDPCGYHADCTNTPGSFLCSCLRGYLMGLKGCQDIDECVLAAVTGLRACGRRAECTNTPGSFICSCPLGYVLALDGHNCVDVDECNFEENCRRELGNVCVNTEGSYKCSCQHGFREVEATCADVDECVEQQNVCVGGGECENTLGSYRCVCKRGYRGNGTHCSDINECLSGDHGCDVNARCGNIIGSYFCQCHQGYSGDGHACYDVDECAQDNGLCEHNCTNEPGTHSCHCSTGYTLTRDLHNCTGKQACQIHY
ncbi:putative fibrillin-2 [Triplophysa rosa]|uniref:Fibrillin-2 n=1 Tax=Triplophysa rosa TaxID=992332 RepID=A0A9W7WHK3_TRIRA|nr:putative fibrillin-2 [Triplophysa rosa]